MTYKQILDSVHAVGGYITDPIGKCLRTTSRRKSHRIDLEYKESETYAAFKCRDDLAKRFDPKRAIPADLIWVEVPATGEQSPPWPVLVDRVSGIVQEVTSNGTMHYGFLTDVQGCVHYHSRLSPTANW